jgi:OOP family OmpA-OmpF porin
MLGAQLRFLVVSLFALSLLVPVGADAENRAGALTVTPLTGAHIFKDSEHLKNSQYYGLAIGYNLNQNFGFELVGTGADVQDEMTARDFRYYTGILNLLYHFRPDKQFVPYISAGGGVAMLDTPGGGFNEDPLLNYGVGFKYFATDWLALRVDARHAVRHQMSFNPVDHGKNYGNFLLSTGLSFQLGGDETQSMKSVDSDHDGVADAIDRCPGTPASVFIDAYGCPRDTDDDGVIDDVDQCPGTVAGAEVDSLGCAILTAPVTDALLVADADFDGVPDAEDRCPNTPAGMPVNERGCLIDSDQDGVFDMDDNCPQTPAGTRVGADGCPDLDAAPITENFAQMDSVRLNIEFASNSSIIAPRYAAEMRRAAEFSRAHPEKVLLVEGHTDNTGSDEVNRKLSQHRADTVRWILVRDYGVDATKIKAKGFGESKPVGDNNTIEGRKSNRRVLVRLMD